MKQLINISKYVFAPMEQITFVLSADCCAEVQENAQCVYQEIMTLPLTPNRMYFCVVRAGID